MVHLVQVRTVLSIQSFSPAVIFNPAIKSTDCLNAEANLSEKNVLPRL